MVSLRFTLYTNSCSQHSIGMKRTQSLSKLVHAMLSLGGKASMMHMHMSCTKAFVIKKSEDDQWCRCQWAMSTGMNRLHCLSVDVDIVGPIPAMWL